MTGVMRRWMEVEKEEQFDVRMLGHFSVKYGGKEISLGRSSTLKSVQMLQLVWLYGDQGIRQGSAWEGAV